MTEELWANMTFSAIMKHYYRLSTDAPKIYCDVLSNQLLGHALGYNPVNLIQPSAVRHNCYVGLEGKSTLTRKTTSQTFASDIYPLERRASEETSPESFVEELSNGAERIHFMPELSAMLKGITGKGYMARFAEVYNDLHGCPELYVRKLRPRKGKKQIFRIDDCYLSVCTTITPEVLKQNLTEELMYGGFIVRFLIVHGEPKIRPRDRLNPEVFDHKARVTDYLNAVIQMEKKGVYFVLSDQALERYREIERSAYSAYERVSVFAGRYLNYVIAFADTELVSDAIGVSAAKNINPYSHRRLVELVRLKSLVELDKVNRRVWEKFSKETVTPEWLVNLFITSNDTNHTNYLIVPREYIDRAWKIIQPCLDYVLDLANYVEMDKPTAKLREYMQRVKKAPHSEAMRNTNLNAKQMEIARETLVERKEIEIKREKYQKHGREYERPIYEWIGD